jgi:hypothetical protein
MKKTITIAILLFSMATYAQGNLQFNQVVTYTGSLNNAQQISSTYTVPVGKIWKIKYVSKLPYKMSSQGTYANYYEGFGLIVNNLWTYGDNYNELFLKAGDTLKVGYYNQQNQSTYFAGITLDFVISIVEFNIVQ